jgi:hypothetical protein
MENKAELFFEAGADGGGEALYRRNDGSFFLEGSGGGMLDEDEDPHVSWTGEFSSFELYWEYFVKEHGNFWIFLYPLFIHPDAREFIRNAVDSYPGNFESRDNWEYHKDTWLRAMEERPGRF